MLFWPKLLTIAHAIASSVRPYLPLYFSHLLGFCCSDICMLLALPLALRSVSLGFWTVLVIDQKPPLHGFFMAVLTAIGTAALSLILWIPPHASFAWSAAFVCMIFDGLFYQPLGVLIDSAIIKILGDYKILCYDSQRQWGDLASALMAIGIGWSLDDDHDFDTLMGSVLMGSVLLFLLSLSTTVSPADPALLGLTTLECDGARIQDVEEREEEEVDHVMPLLQKQPLDERPPSPRCYKPYCLFNERLSHISEEDASMLRRMASISNTHVSYKQQRPSSICSSSSLDTEAHSVVTFRNEEQHQTAADDDDPCCYPSSRYYWVATTANDIRHEDIFTDMPSLQLALFPCPSPETPMIVLAPLLASPFCQLSATEDLFTGDASSHNRWSAWSLSVTVSLLGLAAAMMNALLYLYLHDGLGLPMHLVGLVGMITVASKVAAKPVVHWLLRRFRLHVITTSAHGVLVLCALVYSWLRPNAMTTRAVSVVLQIFQAITFHGLWFMAVRQVDAVLLTAGQHRRMILRGKMSLLFDSLAPAMGAVMAGYLVDMHSEKDILTGFIMLYRCTAAVLVLSLTMSWGWSLTRDG